MTEKNQITTTPQADPAGVRGSYFLNSQNSPLPDKAASYSSPAKAPLAWAAVRHQVIDNALIPAEKQVEEEVPSRSPSHAHRRVAFWRTSLIMIVHGHCQHAVLISCLHLAHEMNLREVGLYGWVQAQHRDAQGSTLKIMKSKSIVCTNFVDLFRMTNLFRSYKACSRHGH